MPSTRATARTRQRSFAEVFTPEQLLTNVMIYVMNDALRDGDVVLRRREMPQGGHLAAMEQPGDFGDGVRAFGR